MKNSYFFVLFLSLLISPLLNAQQAVYTKSIGGFNSEFMLPQVNNSLLVFGEKTEICKIDAYGIVQWTKKYSFPSLASSVYSPHFYEAESDLDSNIITVGQTAYQQLNGFAFCMKIKRNGDTLWCRKLTDPNYSTFVPYDVSLTNDSGYVITGSALSANTPTQQLFVAKLSKLGNLAWMKTFSSSSFMTSGGAIKQTPDSGFVIAGSKQNSAANNWSILVMKIGKTGIPQWSNEYTDGSASANHGFDLVLNSNNFSVLAATSKISLLNFNLSGNINWSQSYNAYPNISHQSDKDMRLKKTGDKGYLIINKCIELNPGLVIRTDSSGNPTWDRSFSLLRNDALQNSDKTYSFIGNKLILIIIEGKDAFNFPDIQILKFDSFGNSDSACYYGGNSSTTLVTVTASALSLNSSSSGIISSIQPTLSSVLYNSGNGCIVYVGGIHENAPNSLSLYPNPANEKVTLKLNQASGKSLFIKLIDISGKEIFTKDLQAQTEEYDIDCSKIEAGIYTILILEDKILTKTGKLIIAR